MRFSAISIALAAFVQLASAATTACNANDCLRQVRASSFPSRSTRQDCAAYQTTTKTSTTVTTATVTATTAPKGSKRGLRPFDALLAVVGDERLLPRAAASGTVPAYASSCTSAGAYASACSCIGVTASTSTVTTTSTSTVTVTATPTPTMLNIVIVYPVGTVRTDIYISIPTQYLVTSSDPTAAEPFIIDSSGALRDGEDTDYYVSSFPSNPYTFEQVLDFSYEGIGGSAPFLCSVDALQNLNCLYGTAPAVFGICSTPAGQTLFSAQTFAAISSSPYADCVQVTLKAPPVAT